MQSLAGVLVELLIIGVVTCHGALDVGPVDLVDVDREGLLDVDRNGLGDEDVAALGS